MVHMAHGMIDVSADFRILIVQQIQEVPDFLAFASICRRAGIGDDW